MAYVVLFAVVPLVFTVWAINDAHVNDQLAFDLHYGAWPAGRRVLDGLSPYATGWFPPDRSVGLVYPAPTALLFALIALVPRDVADAVATGLAIAAPLVALRLLGVTDWRLYGLVLLWAPVVSGWKTANVSIFLVPLAAALWAFRSREVVAGVLLGVLVALKLFLWPLGVFFLATRRYAAIGYSLALLLVVNVVAWPVLGLDELARYRHAVDRYTDVHQADGFGVASLVVRLGADRPFGYAAAGLLGAILGIWAFRVGRRGDQRLSFVHAIAASLALSPIVEVHYLALLVVALGVMRREIDLLWMLPLLLWVGGLDVHPATWQVIPFLAISACVFAALVLRRSPPRSAPAAPPPAAR